MNGHFEKGNKGKKKGTVNKKTKFIREAVQNFLIKKFEKVDDLYDELKPAEQAKLIVGLMAYAVPKLNAEVTKNGEDKKDISVNIFRVGDQEIPF